MHNTRAGRALLELCSNRLVVTLLLLIAERMIACLGECWSNVPFLIECSQIDNLLNANARQPAAQIVSVGLGLFGERLFAPCGAPLRPTSTTISYPIYVEGFEIAKYLRVQPSTVSK